MFNCIVTLCEFCEYMILPIYLIGNPVLKKVAQPISDDYEGLNVLIQNMWETMYNAHGVGLAAPQVGHSIRLFIIDSIQVMSKEDLGKGVKKVFINAEKLEESGDFWDYEEGCLSIPNIRGDVSRPPKIKLKYLDEHFNEHIEEFTDINARVIQHEYDHLEGDLFVEKLKPIKKRRIQKKLNNIKKGITDCDYKVKVYSR